MIFSKICSSLIPEFEKFETCLKSVKNLKPLECPKWLTNAMFCCKFHVGFALKSECCWAFAATAAIEGVNQITTGELVTLSEQQILDCEMSNIGCSNSGQASSAYEYVIMNGGIGTDDDYPYHGKKKKCMWNSVSFLIFFGNLKFLSYLQWLIMHSCHIRKMPSKLQSLNLFQGTVSCRFRRVSLLSP